MVIALSPGKFYGSSPQIYTDIKYNTDHIETSIIKRQEASFSPMFNKIAKKEGKSQLVQLCHLCPIANKRKRRFVESVMKAVVRFGRARNDLNEDMLK
ncbi:hypothetical protein Tco_0382944 [Tanacetum coccineum]